MLIGLAGPRALMPRALGHLETPLFEDSEGFRV